MHLAGVSVRRVEGITAALWGTRVSPGTVSRLNQKIHAQIAAWRNRPIAGTHPYVHLDGVVLKRSWAGEARNVSLLVAVGVSADGFREVDGAAIDGHPRGGQGGQGAARRRRTRPRWSPVPLLGDAVTASGVGLERHGGCPGIREGAAPLAT
jgi:putative transposase